MSIDETITGILIATRLDSRRDRWVLTEKQTSPRQQLLRKVN